MTKQEVTHFFQMNEEIMRKKYHVASLALFGSYLAGSESEDSDIDLLVSFNEALGWKFLDLKFFLEEHFGKKVDLVTPDALHWFVKDKILSEAEYIYE